MNDLHPTASVAIEGSLPTPAHPLLDDRKAIAEIDSRNVLGSIEQLSSQCEQVWEASKSLRFSAEYSDINQIVVAGMGGSILGTHVIQSVFKDALAWPITIVPDYSMPAFVGPQTLVIASSYSGTTEETIAAVKDAHSKGAKITGITSGGELAELLTSWQAPVLVFETTYNPSNSPRMGLGYSIFGQMSLLARLGLLKVGEEEFEKVRQSIAQSHLHNGVNISVDANPAKMLAFSMIDRIPVITTAEHLEGTAHVFANQLNESAKTFAEFRTVPEINHHLMEGLQFPPLSRDVLFIVLVTSQLYSAQNQRRMELTQEVIEQNHIEATRIELVSKTPLEQVFELLVMASYTSFYLALLNGQDPAPNPWVDWFKAELKK